ncbi:hypothetical protein HNP38_001863 [Chryseobacterium defluvii]|uniref:Uncharacterized protein n=1 Tax=Chryseobacterium defluvii TaxID=160396 RepID=A0A840KF12_9FLAO|nr:hypothetical protein [Chryseobacterium defluvii]MBB4806567.1 hypothetical protein [Chryseobacterium defluvii]
MSCTLLVAAFFFMQAVKRNDSSDNKSIEKNVKVSTIFIAEGTVISGIEKIPDVRLDIIEEKNIRNTYRAQKKKFLKKYEKRAAKIRDQLKNSRQPAGEKTELSDKGTKEKYSFGFSKELKAIAENEHKSNYSDIVDYHLPIRLFLEKKKIIKTFEKSRCVFFIDETSFIRPPPRI